MNWPALIVAGFALAASADKDTDRPHRDWGLISLDMPAEQATICIVRTLSQGGSATSIPVDGGSDIDVASFTTIPKMAPWQTFKIRPAPDGGATMRILYRRPITAKQVGKNVRRLTEDCLKVRH